MYGFGTNQLQTWIIYKQAAGIQLVGQLVNWLVGFDKLHQSSVVQKLGCTVYTPVEGFTSQMSISADWTVQTGWTVYKQYTNGLVEWFTNRSRIQNWVVTAFLPSIGYTEGEKGGGVLRNQSKDLFLFEYDRVVMGNINTACTSSHWIVCWVQSKYECVWMQKEFDSEILNSKHRLAWR